MWKFLATKIRKFPWISSVALYSCVFAAGDLAQQNLSKKEKVDFKQTRNVTTLALTFHGHFIYLWMKTIESVFPGATAGIILRKLACDQLIGTPTGISAFYIGMSILEGKQDIFADWKKKFWSTEKAAVIFWPMVQIISYSMVPVFLRMAYFGCWGFVWTIFISHLRQNIDSPSSENQ
ncbi:mpv17-like protein isoform X2 [Hemitrygon akajei]|uniref:mpv17-like protein isoform X2 n=1 Tax=Hemitrygon akajei TaxID=2704970 RepID=UPI003BF97EB3